MDKVLADTLKANLKSANTPEAKLDAIILAMIAVVDCQLSTTSRVKTMWEDRGRFAWAGRVVWGIVTAVGFAGIIKAMRIMGAL